MIIVDDLCKNYDELEVLKGVSLHIEKGSIHGLVGISGAGKSTLLRSINGIEDFDSGSLRVMGQDVQNLNKRELSLFRRDIGMIFQNFALMERKNVYQNIAFPLECWNVDQSEIAEKVDNLLDMVGISEKKKEKPRNLSGGQRQRVAIARALALEPKILLCDEATSVLDPQTTNNILKLLLKINNELGITMVVVTHEMEVAKTLCDSISIMADGLIVETNNVERVFASQSEALKQLIGTNTFPVEGQREVLRLFLSSEIFGQSILNNLTCAGFDYRLEDAQVDHGKKGRFSTFYISLTKPQAKQAYNFLKQQVGLEVNKYDSIQGRIIKDVH